MDGFDHEYIIKNKLMRPYGITYDEPADKLYWFDGFNISIQSSDVLGKNKKVWMKNRSGNILKFIFTGDIKKVLL